MTDTLTLSQRMTHEYVGAYSDLDQWVDLGTVELIAASEVEYTDPSDICEPTRQVRLVRVVPDLDAGATDKEIQDALEDTFSSSGCGHDFDCCGCRSYTATAEKAGKYWAVTITSSRNF